ncbi:MAG: MerR family transcriptional regulator [Oscillospiraceae bacterium]|nr:MerR family transcriptional regulator [Oscillospiraceae bacterium]
MELISIRQVSLDYGISRQMLSYYEEVGLIKSSRTNASAYRVYDEAAVKRLQQIILLRKLQVPMKKICVILNNPKAATVIEIFKESIAEMEKEISALSTIKVILGKFVSEIEKITAVNMNLNLLTDDSVQKMAESLSLIQKNIKENYMSMNELNQAAETLEKEKEKSVSIVYRPPATIVEIKGDFGDNPRGDGKHRKIVEDIAKKFIEDTDLFKIKPDMRVFMLGEWWNDKDQDAAYITIPDDMEVPPPFAKRQYPGGLYAASTDSNLDLVQWAEDSDNYEWHDNTGKRAYGWEYFNPFNVHGLSDYDYEKDWACSYTTELCPVREVKKLSYDEKKRIHSELDNIISRSEPVEIDLVSMILQKKDGGICELNYPNGLLELKYDNGWTELGKMLTTQQFNAPIKIELCAKTDKGTTDDENLWFGCAEIDFDLCDQEKNAKHKKRNALQIYDRTNGGETWNIYKNCGVIPANEFMDIEIFLGRESVALRVNGDLRHYSSDYGYIRALKENREYSLGAVWVGTILGSTVTVQSLRVTEI